MNSRERVLAAINHQTPDRPPRDIGSTTTTGINYEAYTALKNYLKLPNPDQFEFLSSRALVARVEDEIIHQFGLDVLPIISKSTGIPPLMDEKRTYVDRWGVERTLPNEGGHYYVSHPPLADIQQIADLNQIPWPEPLSDHSELAEQAKYLYENTDKALVLNLSIGFLHQSQFMRGYDNWLMDLASDPALAEAYMDRILDIWLAEADATITACKDYAHIVTYTDDIAFQTGPMMSLRMFQKLIKPRQRKIFNLLRQSGMKVFYHSCGSLISMLDDYVEMGVEILNPVQVSAQGMDHTEILKQRWGKDLVFWGAIDTQHILPHGSTLDVKREAWRRLNDLSENGGYVLACVHDIQAEVAPENICAIFEAANEWSPGFTQ